MEINAKKRTRREEKRKDVASTPRVRIQARHKLPHATQPTSATEKGVGTEGSKTKLIGGKVRCRPWIWFLREANFRFRDGGATSSQPIDLGYDGGVRGLHTIDACTMDATLRYSMDNTTLKVISWNIRGGA